MTALARLTLSALVLACLSLASRLRPRVVVDRREVLWVARAYADRKARGLEVPEC